MFILYLSLRYEIMLITIGISRKNIRRYFAIGLRDRIPLHGAALHRIDYQHERSVLLKAQSTGNNSRRRQCLPQKPEHMDSGKRKRRRHDYPISDPVR